MKARIQFLKFYFKLPKIARRELICGYPTNPMSMNVCYIEIYHNTKLGDKILEELGFVDEI